MPGNVTISTANLPEGTCPSWIIPLWANTLVPALIGNLQGSLNTFNYGSSTPAAADQDKPWIKLTASGYPDGQYWVYKGGFWLKQHPMFSGAVILWEGDITTIDTLDGGETAALSLTTGPMWEQVTAAKGRMPIGAGPMITSGTIVAPTDVGGEETHLLTVSEIPAHNHTLRCDGRINTGSEVRRPRPADTTGTDQDVSTTDTGGGATHNNMPPWYGIHLIRRTSRMYYRA